MSFEKIDDKIKLLKSLNSKTEWDSMDTEILKKISIELYELSFLGRKKNIDPVTTEINKSSNESENIVKETTPTPIKENIVEIKTEPVASKLTEDVVKQEPEKKETSDIVNNISKPRLDLAEKFAQSKIDDINKAITLSKKFEFINTLFKNQSDIYKEIVNTINQSNNKEEIFELITSIEINYKWHENEELAFEFKELINRKFV